MLSKGEFKVATIWFIGGSILSGLILLYAINREHPIEGWYQIGKVLLVVIPFYAAFSGILTYRYKQLCIQLMNNSEQIKGTIISKKFKRHNRVVDIKYSFRASDGQVFERRKEYLMKQVKKMGFLNEIENDSLTILYNSKSPKDNVWKFETTYCGGM